MKYYITKYALTSGIQELHGEVNGSLLRVPNANGYGATIFHREGRDWHRTREAAINRALEMRSGVAASFSS